MSEAKAINARISLPSKGRLAEETLGILKACGLAVYKPNPRQYEAEVPSLPGLKVLFQRPADIVVSVRDGSVDFGITGLDVVAERRGPNGDVLVLHEALGFGGCWVALAAPESLGLRDIKDLQRFSSQLSRPLRVATKYPVLTGAFLTERQIRANLITAEGTLETAPAIGYADIIADVVSSGQTLQDNRLQLIEDGALIKSEAVLIANKNCLRNNPKTLRMARILLEYLEAHLRAKDTLAIFANMRAGSPKEVADRIFENCNIHGLQGPTVSRVIVRDEDPNWYAANLIVPRQRLFQTIQEIRAAGGSGVVAMPVAYIFEEEPPRYRRMLEVLGNEQTRDGEQE
ncbi:MAG: ATP phosphoribosyltransferase [Anaerolineaceae bacterium]|nr:ATP phosphoribosyltransferase [Anaerolineaceae bacterium]